MPLRPKKWLAGLELVTHGGINQAEMESIGLNPADVLDFSVSTNPFMPPPGLKKIIRSAPIERYPDSSCTALRRRLAQKLGISPDNIIFGSGTTELIRLVTMAYLRRRDTALIIGPAYSEYQMACRIAGARVIEYRAPGNKGFRPDMNSVVKLVNKYSPRLVFLCNPNNPTGKYLPRENVRQLLELMRNRLLLLDEAYVSFVENAWNSLDFLDTGNVIVLRSMTKDYGIPGLRLGYAVAAPENIKLFNLMLPPWNVNTVAQAAGAAALNEDDYLRRTLSRTREAKNYLAGEFSRLGFKVVPSDAHYFLVKVGDAAAFRLPLLKQGILVRDCSSFGLSRYIRISPRSLPECQKLITAVEQTVF